MKASHQVDCRRLELDGIRYVILRESVFDLLCQKSGLVEPELQEDPMEAAKSLTPAFDFDRASLAEKLHRRRRAAGLSQAELARRAGVRPETLNRIERGRTEPDFTTIRKLVLAMNAAELDQAKQSLPNAEEPIPIT